MSERRNFLVRGRSILSVPPSLRCAGLSALLTLASCAQQQAPEAPLTKPVVAQPVPATAPTPSAAAGPPAKGARAEPDGERSVACDAASAEGKAARAKLDALDARVKKLAAAGDPKPLEKEIEKLLDEEPCFALTSATHPYPMTFDSGLSLHDWWEQGGRWWIESQLVTKGAEVHWLVLPPTSRRSLASDVNTVHPLAPLLCPADAAMPKGGSTCGAETLGWMRRADQALARHADARRLAHLHSDGAELPATRERCAAKAKAGPAAAAYLTYASCMHLGRPTADALPLGRFAAPKDGWLAIRGRRGHHSGCEELRTYDLATGAAYVAKACWGFGQQGNRHSTEVGRVPLDALREAALVAFLAEVADRDVAKGAEGHAVPPGIEIAIPAGVGAGIGLSGFGWSSGRTVLEVGWVRGGRGQARTTVDWPDSDTPAREHAAELLAVAEAGFVAGCAPAALPAIPWSSLGPRLDPKGYMPSTDGQPAYAQLEADFAALRGRPLCPAK